LLDLASGCGVSSYTGPSAQAPLEIWVHPPELINLNPTYHYQAISDSTFNPKYVTNIYFPEESGMERNVSEVANNQTLERELSFLSMAK
jgi:hypothetical protein